MCTSSIAAFPRHVTFLALYLFVTTAIADWDYKYCSSENTADTSAFFWTWQSNGKCHDHCTGLGDFAFFVLQDKNCWCSNYIPEEQSDISDCSETCPGFDSENCGKAGEYYIYVNLNGNPSGTAGAASAQPSSSSVSPSPSTEAPSSTSPSEATTPSPAPPNSSATAQTRADTSTASSMSTSAVVVPSPGSSSTSSSSSQQPTSATDDTPDTAVPGASIRTVTDNGGAVITQIVIVTPSVSPQAERTGKSTSNTGAIVGGVVGGIGALAAIVAGVFFLLWRRRKQQRNAHGDETGEQNESGVHRYASTMSKAGLLRGEKEPKYPAPIATSSNRRHSRNLDQESVSPISVSNRRNSSFRIADQRLNPSTIFVFDNTSRASVGSLDDSRDYHRTLNVRNPDAP